MTDLNTALSELNQATNERFVRETAFISEVKHELNEIIRRLQDCGVAIAKGAKEGMTDIENADLERQINAINTMLTNTEPFQQGNTKASTTLQELKNYSDRHLTTMDTSNPRPNIYEASKPWMSSWWTRSTPSAPSTGIATGIAPPKATSRHTLSRDHLNESRESYSPIPSFPGGDEVGGRRSLRSKRSTRRNKI